MSLICYLFPSYSCLAEDIVTENLVALKATNMLLTQLVSLKATAWLLTPLVSLKATCWLMRSYVGHAVSSTTFNVNNIFYIQSEI